MTYLLNIIPFIFLLIILGYTVLLMKVSVDRQKAGMKAMAEGLELQRENNQLLRDILSALRPTIT